MKNVHEQLYKDDCLETFLNIWDEYFQQKDYHEWALDNYIFEKAIKDINRHKMDFVRVLQERMKLRIPFEIITAFKENYTADFPTSSPDVLKFLREVIEISHKRWTFKYVGFARKGIAYEKIHGDHTANYFIDSFSKSKIANSRMGQIVAFTQRRKGINVFLSNTVLI
jgi:hypothetical protein